MAKTLKDLEPFLKVLDFKNFDKVPSFSDLKKAYRAKLHLHPDKASKDSTENDKKEMTHAFQEVSEAVHEIFFFLVENVEAQKKGKKNEEGTNLLRYFEQSCEMVYNKGSITFYIEDDIYDVWMHALGEKFGSPPEPLREKEALLFRMENFEVTKLGNLGKVTASCWKKPSSDGRSKIVLQGKAYMPFFTFAIPEMISEISKQIVTKSVSPAVGKDSSEKSDDVVKGKKVVDVDIDTLATGFEKLQTEVLNLRDSIVLTIDNSVEQLKDNIKALSLKEDMDKLGKAVVSNTKQLSSLQETIDGMIKNQTQVNPIDSNALDDFLTHSNTVFSKLEEITSIHQAAVNTPVVLDTEKIVGKLEEMTIATNDIKSEVKQLESKERQLFKEATENVEQSLPVLKSIEEKVSKLLTSLDASPDIQPSVRPKEATKPPTVSEKSDNIQAEAVTKEHVDETETEDAEQITDANVEVSGRRKALFFSSSIGLGCNLVEMEKRLDCEILPIPTYHIVKRVGARDPELNVKENLKVELEKRKDIDFLIVATGSNDITYLDIENKSVSELTTIACNQSRDLVHMLNEAALKHNLDVFVVEKPPRDDNTNKEDNKILTDCNTSSNGLFPSLITPLEKVHYIPLPAFQKISDKSRMNLFDVDGIHIKHWGLKLMSEDIISGVRNVYTDISAGGTSFQKDGRNQPQNNVNQHKNRANFDNFDGRGQNTQNYSRQWDNRRKTSNENMRGGGRNENMRGGGNNENMRGGGRNENMRGGGRENMRGGGHNPNFQNGPPPFEHQNHYRENLHPDGRNEGPPHDERQVADQRNHKQGRRNDNSNQSNNRDFTRRTFHPDGREANNQPFDQRQHGSSDRNQRAGNSRGQENRSGQQNEMDDLLNLVQRLMENRRY